MPDDQDVYIKASLYLSIVWIASNLLSGFKQSRTIIWEPVFVLSSHKKVIIIQKLYPYVSEPS